MVTTGTSTTIRKADYTGNLRESLGQQHYKQQMMENLVLNVYLKIKEHFNHNQRSMHKVKRNFIPGVITEQVKNIKHKIYWSYPTEQRSGDVSKTLPAFDKITSLGEGRIEMNLAYPGQDDELMNAYLTTGTQAIPKLIHLDTYFYVTGTWGGRLTAAQKSIGALKLNTISANNAIELQRRYAKEK